MGEININTALQRIRSLSVKERQEGLADLKHILRQNRRSPNINKLNDKAYHSLFEALFRVAQNEKPQYNKVLKSAKDCAQSASRLSACASVLRLAVEVGVKVIRIKTVRALIDHITQILPISDDYFCEPLVRDYIKALRATIAYQPHLEHLPQEEWLAAVDFCNEAIKFYATSVGENDSTGPRFSNLSDRLVDRGSRMSTPSSFGNSVELSRRPHPKPPASAEVTNILDDLVFCLCSLVCTSNAVLLAKAQSVILVLLELLQSSTKVGGAYQAAFASINMIIATSITEEINLARETFKDVLPIIRNLWPHNMSQTVREELLVTLIYGEPLFAGLVEHENGEEFRIELQALFDVIRIEYCKRLERDHLQIDDLTLERREGDLNEAAPLSLSNFRLRSGISRAEQTWAVLQIMGTIFTSLHRYSSRVVSLEADDFDLPLKRRKIEKPIDGILRHLSSPSNPERLFSLQILAFVISESVLDVESTQNVLMALMPIISSDNNILTNWAMLAVSCATSDTRASIRACPWLQIWQLAIRNITAISTCRVACHVVSAILESSLVEYADIADTVGTILSSVDLNGPACFTDSAVNLWTVLLKLKRQHSPGFTHDTAERVMRWLLVRWKPSHIHDRHNISQLVYHGHARPVLHLVSGILDLPTVSNRYQSISELGKIAQTILRCKQKQPLVNYLLLVQDLSIKTLPPKKIELKTQSQDPKNQSLRYMLMDYLCVEITTLLDTSPFSESSDIKTISAETVHIASSTSIVAFALVINSPVRETAKVQHLQTLAGKLSERTAHLCFLQGDPKPAVDGLLSSIGELLGPLSATPASSMCSLGSYAIASNFGVDFWRQLQIKVRDSSFNEDLMDMDVDFTSQSSNSRTHVLVSDNAHDWLAATTNARAREMSLSSKVCLAAMQAQVMESEKFETTDLPAGWIAYLISLDPEDFLACRPLLKELFDSDIDIGNQNGTSLLEYLGDQIMVSYEFERCETSLGLCLDIMTSLTTSWTDGSNGVIADFGKQFYEWFINIALEKKILSPHVQLCLAKLLQRIIKVKPDYGKDLALPSARTSLLRILEDGTIAVKYSVGLNISSIFGLFILKEHDAILEDIINSLPSEGDWDEGMALRLFVLGHLGASWSTLLRRCLYAIFETPGRIPKSTKHAKQCIKEVSLTLKIQSPQALFKLFVSQIIYTWLESETLRSIPYSVFGYTSLPELLQDVQPEVVGQIVMRGRDAEAEQLSQELSKPYDQLLGSSFTTAAAYCIARDAAIPPKRDTQASGAASRLRKLLNKDHYTDLIQKHFAPILATFYKTMDQEDHIIKGFKKSRTYDSAHNIYKEISSYGASTVPLPVNQQPSFKAGYLMEEIDYLYSRSPYDPEVTQSSALYVYTFRELLNTIQKPLGSLHACTVIRRLRILISLAGNTALQDYAVEMALHSLRPFLTDTHCAEDTIGIFRYLLIHGKSYFQKAPSFFTGLLLSTLLSTRRFLGSRQESTTQESQFRNTMSKAVEFHSWLGTYGEQYNPQGLSGEAEASLKAMVRSARQITEDGNARKGTSESDLLLQILEDQRSERNLIDEPSRDLILNVLCENFGAPADFREDILGSDEQAAMYASVVWDTCQNSAQDSGYILWAGRVLGRAYGGSGFVNRAMLREVNFPAFQDSPQAVFYSHKSNSTFAILHCLRKVLLRNDRDEVGVAERTLQSVITEVENAELYTECEQALPASLLASALWKPFICPRTPAIKPLPKTLTEAIVISESTVFDAWIQELCVALVSIAMDDPLLSNLTPVLSKVRDMPERLFPYILHLTLLREADKKQEVRQVFSNGFGEWLDNSKEVGTQHVRLMLHTLLYLRTQALPHETTKADRSRWLDINHRKAAAAAIRCRMFKTALLMLEVESSEAAKVETSRRSSGIRLDVPNDLLLHVYQNLDDKDYSYGVRQPSSLESMMDQLEYENAGFKSLSFKSAYYDSQIRLLDSADQRTEDGLVKVLDSLDLNGLSQSLLSNMTNSGSSSIDAMLRTARKLERWDISSPSMQTGEASILFRGFQDVHNAQNYESIRVVVDDGLSATMMSLLDNSTVGSSVYSRLACLSVLTEMEEVLYSQGREQLQESWARLSARHEWMLAESSDHLHTITSCRKTLFGTLSKASTLQTLLKVSPREAREVECQALLESSVLSRRQGALQSALATATFLAQLIPICSEMGLRVDVAVHVEGSNVLWDQEEISASIRMLKDIIASTDLVSQDIKVGKPALLAKLGHRVSEARLEKPDEIIGNYLNPAITELCGVTNGAEAGQVFHEFAAFCDKQLQSSDNLEDYQRIQTLRERKEAEVLELDRMIKSANSQSKEKVNMRSYRTRAKLWLDLDDQELRRVKDSRQAFLRQSLENYLQSLKACDTFDSDVLRFAALWLEYSENESANTGVKKYIDQVASRKFASLMNQWTSRLLDSPDKFQALLSSLVLRICVEHPYHGMYQIFASSKTKGGKDQAALARHAAALGIVERIKASKLATEIWLNLHNSSVAFVRFASERLDDIKIRPGVKVPLRRSRSGQKLEQDIATLKIPPPTMKVELRPDCDYSATPLISRFQTEFTVASGISMPKILTAMASNGRNYKQLVRMLVSHAYLMANVVQFKSGNDDLRQDAIMEQVFEQVSNLLKTDKESRRRNLGIRAYKVLPLTSTSGIIEFVPDTIPLHDYLMPAHQRHFPSDLKTNACRKHIQEAQSKSLSMRVNTYQNVCARFHPVLRYFFMERFDNPDDWFEKRLAYTRSTAAISILGYILGLGDRHGHNILLDEKTGEVIHIDLGIAFEQGRVLPVPEVVPFRLTRDIVDGMGITKTEGVFRRCCEFTLGALRSESYSIMTILDVLRYDPLYSWSLSPLRRKRQQEKETVNADDPLEEALAKHENHENEPGEADRALTVVSKKLSKSLSVAATVNELIQQATDERNLAALYCGWAAYA